MPPRSRPASSITGSLATRVALATLAALFALVGCASGLDDTGAARYAATTPSPEGTYTHRHWPKTTAGYYNMDGFVTIETVHPTAPYFWSHQFSLQNVQGGYIGLQNNGVFFDGKRGKLAIFSIWNTNGADATASATGGRCGTFGGEGVGHSCRIPYNWQPNRKYRVRVWALSTDSQGRWWGGWVLDTTTGKESYIGKIRVPPAGGMLDAWSVNWTEYFGGKLAKCSDQPYARARFHQPTANNGSVRPASHANALAKNAGCSNGKITQIGAQSRHEMGIGGPSSPTSPPPPPPPADAGVPPPRPDAGSQSPADSGAPAGDLSFAPDWGIGWGSRSDAQIVPPGSTLPPPAAPLPPPDRSAGCAVARSGLPTAASLPWLLLLALGLACRRLRRR